MTTDIESLLGAEAEDLLGYQATAIPKQDLHLPGPDFIDRVMMNSDRSATVLRNWQAMTGHGRLANTGYVSFLPVDQGVEHSAGASFAPNPAFFDPASICELAIEAGSAHHERVTARLAEGRLDRVEQAYPELKA